MSLHENVTYKFVLTSPTMLNMSYWSWIVYEMGGKWLYNCCFVWCCFQDLFKTACSIPLQFPFCFFSESLTKVQVMPPYSSTDVATAGKNSCFTLSVRSYSYIVNNLSIAVHAFPVHKLTSLSVDEILLPRYVNWSTYFKGLLFYVVMGLSWLKHLNSVL